MSDLFKDIGKYIYRFVTHRILWLFIVTMVLFGMLLGQLFELQIVIAHTFVRPPATTNEVSIPIPALRGTIYDRHGRPLAVNRLVFVAKIDPSMQRAITNEALLELAQLFERNGEQYDDSFPIMLNPFEFSSDISSHQLYLWKRDMVIPNRNEATAEESFLFLREYHNIDPEMSHEDARRILNLRTKLYRERLIFITNYNPVPIRIASDISQETVAAIAEKNTMFAGVYVDIQAMREYPAGKYMSHIIGYIMRITAEDFAANEHLGYTHQDMFGRQGLERSMEHYLRGTPGLQSIEFDNAGRRIGRPVVIQEPQSGDRLFLTIDLELQMEAYNMLKDYLSRALVYRIESRDHREALPLPNVFISFVRGHNLDIRAVLYAEEGPAMAMQQYILQRFPDAGTSRDDIEHIHSIIIEGIRSGRISPAMMLRTLIGTGQITDPDGSIAEQLISRPQTARDVLVQKIRDWEITPQQINQDPSTGSIVIVDVATGAVLAAVSYPSYDNNRLVNTPDWAYFNHIYNLDPTNPALPRAFREPLAPGSNFKMITAVAALEEGVITPSMRIFDRVTFTRAGTNPPFRCWNSGGHGNINVAGAIAGSCNYFFAEAAWRLGNTASSTDNLTNHRIDRLNVYMMHFGLHESSGVEILELFDQNIGFDGARMASRDFRRFLALQANPAAPAYAQNWNNAETIRTAIGQGLNAYTTAQMTRVMNVFANRGVNYPLHMVGHIENSNGHIVRRIEPMPVCIGLEFSESTWDAVTEGMRLVTEPGAAGTAVGLFRDFPIRIAGKTSTTQQIPTRFHHSAFGAFAPLMDPQISIYVNIPFGAMRAGTGYGQISARIARDMIGVALGLELEAEQPTPLNTLRP